VCSGHRRTCAASRCSAEHPATASAGVASNDTRRADHPHHWHVDDGGNQNKPNSVDNVGEHNKPNPGDNVSKPHNLNPADNAIPVDDAISGHNFNRSRTGDADDN